MIRRTVSFCAFLVFLNVAWPLDQADVADVFPENLNQLPLEQLEQLRDATKAKGKSWLFFGEIHEETCYLYSEEWDQYLENGTLDRVTAAWSRDQAEKVYVQHKILEHGADLWDWLESGAIVYVCGDAERMAPDVDKALHDIIAQHGGKTPEEAAEYVEQMRQDKRYRRDVY